MIYHKGQQIKTVTGLMGIVNGTTNKHVTILWLNVKAHDQKEFNVEMTYLINNDTIKEAAERFIRENNHFEEDLFNL